MFLINLVGMYLSGSRSAMLGFVSTGGLFFIYKADYKEYVTPAAIVGGLSLISLIALSILDVVPLDISGRDVLWAASINAIFDQPLTGYGPVDISQVIIPYLSDSYYSGVGPHNSYIVPFLIGGIPLGLSYMYILVKGLEFGTFALSQTGNHIYFIFYSTLITAIFDGSTIFGISLVSVIYVLVLGYTISSIYRT